MSSISKLARSKTQRVVEETSPSRLQKLQESETRILRFIGENIQIFYSLCKFIVRKLVKIDGWSVSPCKTRKNERGASSFDLFKFSCPRKAGRAFVTETSFYFHCINCCLSFSLISGLPFGLVLDESDVSVPPSFRGRRPR